MAPTKGITTGQCLCGKVQVEIGVPARWAWHYRTLTQLRDALVRERDERDAALRRPSAEQGFDRSDLASEQAAHEEMLAEMKLEDAELAEVDEALARIRMGTYGRCGVTGEPIPAPRLRAIPWARYSQAVEARFESSTRRFSHTAKAALGN